MDRYDFALVFFVISLVVLLTIIAHESGRLSGTIEALEIYNSMPR